MPADLRRLVIACAVLATLTGLFGVPVVLRLLAFALPAPPSQLTATVQGRAVGLSWQSGGGPPESSYWVEAGSASVAADLGRWQTVAPGIAANGVGNRQYFVRVRAANADGVSGPSNEVVVRVGCVAALAAPAGLVANVSGQTVSLSWGAVSGATAYVLDVGSALGASDIGQIPTAAVGLAGRAPDGTYYVRVRAVSACGQSGTSAEVIVRVSTSASGPTIYGSVDPAILGACSAAVHDRCMRASRVRHARGLRSNHGAESGEFRRTRLRVGSARGRDQALHRRLRRLPRLRPRELRAAGPLAQRRRADHVLHRRDGAGCRRRIQTRSRSRLPPSTPSAHRPPTPGGLVQFKMRRSHCQQRASFGLKNLLAAARRPSAAAPEAPPQGPVSAALANLLRVSTRGTGRTCGCRS